MGSRDREGAWSGRETRQKRRVKKVRKIQKTAVCYNT